MGPKFITFTGVDERTDLRRAVDIARRWPVEFAMLFSPKRQGLEPRYPSPLVLNDFIWCDDLPRRAAHLCGGHAREILSRNHNPKVGADLGLFGRVQVNSREPDANAIREFASGWGVRGVAQVRGAFPKDTQVDWLFDCSGGHGVAPESWPEHPGGNRLVGYAGGINPENVRDVVGRIGASGPYWLDMESGVRTNDWLDLDKCEAVCRAVYGDVALLQQSRRTGAA